MNIDIAVDKGERKKKSFKKVQEKNEKRAQN